MATTTSTAMVSAVYRNRFDASAAYDRLIERGFTHRDINVITSESTRGSIQAPEKQGEHTTGSMATEGMGVGGAVGAATGAALAAALAIGTSLVIPGIGVIAGPLAASLAGAGAGAVTGGLVGGLVGYGIPEQNAEAYEEIIRNGGFVLAVHPRTDKEVSEVKKVFEETKGENIYSAS